MAKRPRPRRSLLLLAALLATAVPAAPQARVKSRLVFAGKGLAIGNIANLEERGEDAGFNPVGTGPRPSWTRRSASSRTATSRSTSWRTR